MLILVAGCGSIGKRHIRNLKALKADGIIAHDVNPKRCQEVEQEYGVRAYGELEEALAQKPDAVLICAPTNLHVPFALSAAQNGCHLFIEKPLSHSLDRIDELLKIIAQKKLVTLVSCNMRFYHSIALMKELQERGSIGKVLCARAQFGLYLPDWHSWAQAQAGLPISNEMPQEDYRQGYSANKSLGGGVILDGIHELDYITWFLGEVSRLCCFSSKLSDLDIDTEDTAEILLEFKSGAIADIHLDYIQRFYHRSCQLIGEEGTISWDFHKKQVEFYSAKAQRWQTFPEEPDYDTNQMYVEEIKHFLQCVEGNAEPMQDIRAGKSVLEIALAAKRSAATGKTMELRNGQWW